MKGYAILLIVVICWTFLCGCVTLPTSQTQITTTPQITTTVPTGPVASVIIKARSFDPTWITIPAGTTVTWINEDPITHRVVHLPSVTQAEHFNSGILSPGQSYSYRFVEKGIYEYGDPNIGGGRTSRVEVT
ncbi:MAG: plastocyanin/azurin family copper-binding protein [Methanoregula sp.]|jgi:plastocyanin|nr:plastocyanin/azurin family copper-binding protein [Methanoregula sp.]